MDAFFQDLRYALRTLAKSPGFTLAAVVTLALGIGANTTVFSAASALLLRPARVEDPGRVVRVYRDRWSPLSYQEYQHVRRNNRVFSGMAAERQAVVGMAGASGSAERINGLLVNGDYFRALGVGAARGRTLTAAEDSVPGAHPLVVLSHRFWERRFAGDPGIVGSTLRLNDRAYTVIGVAERGFEAAYLGFAPDLYVPLSEAGPLTGASLADVGGSLYVSARLRPGVSRGMADGNLGVLAVEMTRLDPARREPIRMRVDHSRGIHAELRGPALMAAGMLLGVVGLVLLIACANLANLLLARATARRKEIGVRLALGASRRRLVRQLLTESVLLALLGGVLALLLAVWTTDLLLAFLPQNEPVRFDLSPDRRVLAYTLAVSVGAGILFGLAPALRASSPDVMGSIRQDAPADRRSRLRSTLVVAQVVMSTLLLGSAALLLRSLANAHTIPPGFDAERVVDLPVDLRVRSYSEEQGRTFFRRLEESVEALPGVRSAALAQVVPLSGSNMETSFLLPGDADDVRRMTFFNVVSPGYFATLGIPVLRGRELAEGETEAAVVNEAFVRRAWPNGDALGKRIRLGETRFTVVGIARDAKYVSLGEDPKATLYVPFAASYRGEMTLHVRASGDPAALHRPLAAAAQALDPALPLAAPRSMRDDMGASLLPARFGAILLGVFGGLALLLAAVGIYGVVSYTVVQRTREMGIRAALGASRASVVRLVLNGSMRLVGAGLAAGLVLAIALGKLASGLLYGVSPADPALLLGAPLVLGGAALLASYLPARRAARVDPMVALRSE